MAVALSKASENFASTVKQSLVLVNSKKQPLGYATAAVVTCFVSSSSSLINAGNYYIAAFLNVLVFGIVYSLCSASYIYNDMVDLDIDKVNSKERPLASGNASLRNAKRLVLFLFATSAILTALSGAILMLSEGRGFHTNTIPIIGLLLTLSISNGIMYSHPKIYLKKRFPLKSLSIAAMGALASLIGWTISGSEVFSGEATMLAFSTAAFIFILSIVFDLRDVKGDAMYNVRTFPIVLGITRSCRIMSWTLIAPLGICIIDILLVEGGYQKFATLAITAIVAIVGIQAIAKIKAALEQQQPQISQFINNVRNLRKLYYFMETGLAITLSISAILRL